jgi:diacylglycerol kinase family enzyme
MSSTLNQLPAIWTGDCDDDRLFDFLVKKVKVTFDQEVPYQVGGDARGMRSELVLELGKIALPVVSFR